MIGVILAGGFGTRLRPLTVNVPKPMVPIANVPCMERVVRHLVAHGVTDHVSLLHFQPEAITRHFGDGAAFGCRMRYNTPPEDLGTAGAVRAAQDEIDDDFIVVSADVATDFDLSAILRFHRERNALATITLTRVENPLSYGVVIIDEAGRVQKFLEKPTWGEVFSDLVNTGIYVFRREALDLVPPGANFDFSKDLFPKILERKEPLYGFAAEGYWRDIGTIEQYVASNLDALDGTYRCDLPGAEERRPGGVLRRGDGADVPDGVEIAGTVVVGAGARIAAGARLEDSVVGDGAEVGKGAVLRRAIVWRRARIGAGARLEEETVVACAADVREGAVLEARSIVSDESVVGADATVKTGVKIWPRKWVETGAVVSSSLIWGDKWERSLFGAHGISGIPNLEMSPEFAARIGAAYGAMLGKGAVVYSSRDVHRASRMVNRSLICGLLSVGVNVRDLRVMPIPVVRHAIRTHQAPGGFHARVSPYDPRLLDVKFFDADGIDLPARREKALENLFYREDFGRAPAEETGEIFFPARALEHYRDAYLEAIDRAAVRPGLKVVLDYSNGASTVIFPSILAEIGAEVISLNAFLDERRLARPPDEYQGQLERAGEVAKGVGAQVGFVLEPGSERMRLVDGAGRVVDDQTATLLVARLAIDAGMLAGRKIAAPVTTTRALLEMCEAAGVEVVWTRTAHPAMMQAATARDVGLLVYPRGGVIFPGFAPVFDAMFAVGKIIELLGRIGRPLTEVLDGLPRPRVVHETVRTPWERKGLVMRRFIEEAKGRKVDLIDGVKIWDGRAWFLALPDPDRPFFHLWAEADDEEAARATVLRYADRVWEWNR